MEVELSTLINGFIDVIYSAKLFNFYVAGTNKFNYWPITLDREMNMYKMVLDFQNSGKKFYEVGKDSEKYTVSFV